MKDDDAAPGDRADEGSASESGPAQQPGALEVDPSPGDELRPEPVTGSSLLQAVADTAPGIGVLRRYRRSWLRPDVYAGISVVAYMVPQVMAYTALVGVPPVAGLWTALAALIVYAALGSSRVLSVGPESTIALMAGTAIAPLAGADPDRAVALAAALSLIVGGWCLVGRLARLGVIADLLSQPLLVGYLAGAAVLMVVGQLGKMTGTTVEGDNLVAQLRSFADGRRRHRPADPRGRRRNAGPAAGGQTAATALAGDPDRRRRSHRRVRARPTSKTTGSRWSAQSRPGCRRPASPT